MDYKNAYLYLFNAITDLTVDLDRILDATEQLQQRLYDMQSEAEEICIDREEAKLISLQHCTSN